MRRIFSLVVWTLLALFVVRTCWPGGEPPESVQADVPLEDFGQPMAEDYPLVLENEHLHSRWSPIGAGCGLIVLKDYTTHVVEGEPKWEDLLVLHDSSRVRPKVPPSPDANSPLFYRKRDAFRLVETSDLLFPTDPATRVKPNLDGVEWRLEDTGDPSALRFVYDAPSGVRLVKEVRLEPAAYHFEVTVSAVALPGAGAAAVGRNLTLRFATGGGIRADRDPYYKDPYVGAGLVAYGELDEVDIWTPNGRVPPLRPVAERWSGEVPFVLEGSKYFMEAVLPQGRPFRGAVAEALFDDELFLEKVAAGTTRARVDPTRTDYWLRASVGGGFTLHFADVGAADRRDFVLYAGPKDTRILSAPIYGELAEAVDYADYGTSWYYRIFFTRQVARFLLAILTFFHTLTGNWGVAIVLLTLVVRAAVFPIMRRSQAKMAIYQEKMRKVKPKLDAINEKFADDPQRKQLETMKLYREHKLTPPVGGCLPLLLQMPIFIGLFAALRSSVVLRHKPFVGWIRDLSAPDALIDFGHPIASFWPLNTVHSLNVLPLIMVVLWVVHQRSMPTPTDPQQAKMQRMMTFMPVVFGLLLYNYASGLSLYMITSSLLGIVEQRIIRKRWPVPGTPEARAKAEAAGAAATG